MKIKKIATALCIGLLLFCSPAYATSYSAPTQRITDEIYSKDNGMINVDTEDIKDATRISNWQQNKTSYIITQRSDDGVKSFFFNTPNLQLNIHNYVQKVDMGGFVYTYNKPFEGEESTWNTAAKKYGWYYPLNAYVGEYPDITWNIMASQTPITVVANAVNIVTVSIGNALGHAASFVLGIFGVEEYQDQAAEILSDPYSAITTIEYWNVDYYHDDDNVDRWAAWWEANYDQLKSAATVVKVNKESVLDAVGKEEDGVKAIKKLQSICGNDFPRVLNLLAAQAKDNGVDPPTEQTIRYMPYDLSTMSGASKAYMNNISDPRVDMFAGGVADIFGSIFTAIVRYLGITFCETVIFYPMGWLLSFASQLNQIINLDYLRGQGVDLALFWKGTTGQLTIFLLMLFLLFFLVKSTIELFRTGKSAFFSVISTVFCIGMLLGFLMIPDRTGDVLSNIATKIMSFGTSTISSQVTNEFSTDYASESEKSELSYWMLNFSIWSTYTTNHSIESPGSAYNYGEGTREYINQSASPALLRGNKPINNWQAVYLESAYNGGNEHNAARVVDHFMAPKITDDGSEYGFKVEQNPYYTGNFYSTFPIAGFIIAIVVFLLTIYKFLCFVEFIVNFMMLFIRLTEGVMGGKGELAKPLKEILLSLIRVILFDVAITVVISGTLRANASGFIWLAVLFAGSFYLINIFFMQNPQSPLTPGFFAVWQRTKEKVAMSFALGADFKHINASYQKMNDEITRAKNKAEGKRDVNEGTSVDKWKKRQIRQAKFKQKHPHISSAKDTAVSTKRSLNNFATTVRHPVQSVKGKATRAVDDKKQQISNYINEQINAQIDKQPGLEHVQRATKGSRKEKLTNAGVDKKNARAYKRAVKHTQPRKQKFKVNMKGDTHEEDISSND